MGLGAEGGAGATGAADSSNLYGSGGTGPGQPGVGSTLGLGGAAGGGGGSAGSAAALLKDPKVIQMIGQLLQQGGRFSDQLNKLPPDAKRFFQAAMGASLTRAAGGPGGAPTLGSLQPSEGPYMGDAAAYNIDPTIARSVLSRMGIT